MTDWHSGLEEGTPVEDGPTVPELVMSYMTVELPDLFGLTGTVAADVLTDVAVQADESGMWWSLDWPDARKIAARLTLAVLLMWRPDDTAGWLTDQGVAVAEEAGWLDPAASAMALQTAASLLAPG